MAITTHNSEPSGPEKQMPIETYYKEKLFELQSSNDIPQRWVGTEIERFIMAQNFGYPLPSYQEPQLLISTCIEFRYTPAIPSNYAYVVRTAGGRLIGSEFAVGYVLSRGVKNIILISHNDCGMTKLGTHRVAIVEAYIAQGWERKKAEEYVNSHAPRYAFNDELDSLEQEYYRLKNLFPHTHVAPLFLDLYDRKVHIPKWYHTFLNATPTAEKSTVENKLIDALA